MTFKVRFTEEALADLERLYEFVVTRDDGDWSTAERALDAIRNGLALLGKRCQGQFGGSVSLSRLPRWRYDTGAKAISAGQS